MTKKWASRKFGFTIVELLIIVAVIGILVSIVLVSYSGAQARSRDVRRKSDIGIIVGYLELYAAEHQGLYPISSGSTLISANWSTTAEPASWAVLETALAPYGKIPKDPISKQGVSGVISSNYSYYGGHTSTYCNSGLQYIVTYQLEAEANVATGTCTVNPLSYSPTVTTYRKITN